MHGIGWLMRGPLPIGGVCDIVSAYARALQGKEIARLQLAFVVDHMTKVSPTQIAFTAKCDCKKIHLWDVLTCVCELLAEMNDHVRGLVSTSRHEVVAFTEFEVYLFDSKTRVLTRKIASTFQNFCARRSFTALTGGRVVSLTDNYDGEEYMEFWDMYKGSETRVQLAKHVYHLTAIADGQMVSSGFLGVYLWSREGVCLKELFRFDRHVESLAWLNDTLAVCVVDKVVLFRNGVELSSVAHSFIDPTYHGEYCGTFFTLLEDGSVLLCSRDTINAWTDTWENIPLPVLTRTVVRLDHCRFVGFEKATRCLLAFE